MCNSISVLHAKGFWIAEIGHFSTGVLMKRLVTCVPIESQLFVCTE
jgi:hypothetical protein